MSIKQSTVMPTKLKLTGADIPPLWAKQAGVGEDEYVEVIIRPDRNAAAERILNRARRMRQQAKQRGLTAEKLDALLHDD